MKIPYPKGQRIEFLDPSTGVPIGTLEGEIFTVRVGPDWYNSELCHGERLSAFWLWESPLPPHNAFVEFLLELKQ